VVLVQNVQRNTTPNSLGQSDNKEKALKAIGMGRYDLTSNPAPELLV
jgi:hypothetical protein